MPAACALLVAAIVAAPCQAAIADIALAQAGAPCGPARDSSKSGFKAMATCEARKRGLPPEVAHAVLEIESNFDADARGTSGERGLMQVMPATAQLLGFFGSADALADPAINIELGVRYLAQAYRLSAGDLCATVMKYRAGHAQMRFSALSVRYCLRARAILKRDGYGVSGIVPAPSFGFAAVAGLGAVGAASASSPRPKGVCVRRSFVPGPRYMRCTDYRDPVQARRIRALRAAVVGG